MTDREPIAARTVDPARDRDGAAPRVVAVVAARNEAGRVGRTVAALRSIERVAEVVVADDGSTDATASEALAAGARVVRSSTNLGKGEALSAAIAAGGGDVVLLADGDLGSSASALEAVVRPVVAGEADLAVAVPPRPLAGGFGLVRRSSAWMIRRVSGLAPRAPLSGQRAATAECLRACRPLARGFGVDAAMLADAARLRFRVVEVPVEFEHRTTGRSPAGFRHRARQGRQILAALALRMAGWR